MSRKAMLSLWGLYTYNTNLFDGLQIPEDPDGAAVFQKQDLIDNILLELAELEVLYTDPSFMQQAITAWARKNFPVWQELANTLFYEYDPIENYNRQESWTDTHKIDEDDTDNFTHGHVVTIADDATTTNQVTGYNGSSFGDRDKSILEDDATQTHSGTDSRVVSRSGDNKDTRTGYARGNIGVTTTQQMIEAQREVVKFNVMDYIIDDFKSRFLLLVY